MDHAKFADFAYIRPDFSKVFATIHKTIDALEKAPNAREFYQHFEDLEKIITSYETMSNLALIRHSQDLSDESFAQELECFEEHAIAFSKERYHLARACLSSPYRQDMAERFGSHLIHKLELQLLVYSPLILRDLAKERAICQQYQDFMESAEFDIEGEILSLFTVANLVQDTDRSRRQNANVISWSWFEAHEDELSKIFTSLVQTRQSMAEKMGYANFVPLAYARMGRLGWDQEDAKRFRKLVLDKVVPLCQKLYQDQGKRLGIDDMKYYDYHLKFLDGNPKPNVAKEAMVTTLAEIYRNYSDETQHFIDLMLREELMDFEDRPNKSQGAFSTELPDFARPYVFANLSGNAGDIGLLTHETGHAFQSYLTRHIKPATMRGHSAEVSEIHSLAMELFIHPYMDRFFGQDTHKYLYSHLMDCLTFLPYSASIDEFQEWVYENPQATMAQRNEAYRRIEKKYLPHLDYDGFDFLEKGGRWQRQTHVFLYPFYYLDYGLAQIVAFDFFLKDQKNHDEAWTDFLRLCCDSGQFPYKQLLEKCQLKSPFCTQTFDEVLPLILNLLKKLEDKLQN